MAKSVILKCEDCGRNFLSFGETKCVMCEDRKEQEQEQEGADNASLERE